MKLPCRHVDVKVGDASALPSAADASVALGYFAYNFTKIHRTMRMTPAMAAGVTVRKPRILWRCSKPKKRGQVERRRLGRAAGGLLK